MKRWIPFIALGVVLVLVVAGAAYLWTGDGPDAIRVGDRTVSQRDIDAELQELAENPVIREEIEAAQAQGQQVGALSLYDGSISSQVTTRWITLWIAQEVAALEVAQRDLSVTQADKSQAKELAGQSVGPDVFATLPGWMQEDLVQRWIPVAVLQRSIPKECPSGRFVSHILVGTEAEAQAIKRAIDGGTSFATAAQSNSLDGSAQDGGELGCLDDSQFVEPFATVASTQQLGVVSDPVQTEFGYHLILVNEQPDDPTFAMLGVDEILTVAQGRRVHVDPRYGLWNKGTGQVLPPLTGTSVPGTG